MTKFTDFLTAGKQADRDIAVLASRFLDTDYSNARAAIEDLIQIGSIGPSTPDIDGTYKRAELEFAANQQEIVDDWDDFDWRFSSLVKLHPSDLMNYEFEAKNYRQRVLIACAHIKVTCDAARPWQYKPSSGSFSGSQIVARWDNVWHKGKVCELPMHGSFPASHACVAYAHAKLIENLFGKTFPFSAINEAKRIAEDIGERRIIAGVHFQRDIDAAKTLVDALFP
jgi:hypothetical protein